MSNRRNNTYFKKCQTHLINEISFWGENVLEIVETYKYLGIQLHTYRNRRLVMDKGFSVKIPEKYVSLDCVLSGFLLYGSEVWGFENVNIIERVHLKFLKLAAGLGNSTPNFMVYDELGRETSEGRHCQLNSVTPIRYNYSVNGYLRLVV